MATGGWPAQPGAPATGPWGIPPAPVGRARRRVEPIVLLPAGLMLLGLIVAIVAVAQASAGVLVLGGLLLVGGVAATAVLAARKIPNTGRRVAVIGAVAALAVVILVPASMNVDPCTRIGPEADLAGCDLSGQDLAGEDLQRVDLTGAELAGADLAGANLSGAELGDAGLRRADLAGTNLRRADLTGADLREVEGRSVDLSDADLTGARAQGIVAPSAVLDGATLDAADLTGADLTGATVTGARLDSTDLTDATLTEADLTEAAADGATLAGAVLSDATLAGADLTNADLTGADLSRVGAPGATFEGATMTDAVLRANDLSDVDGLTDEALASALGVPEEQLPAETRLRGLRFDTYEEILAAVEPVRDGEAVPDARSYPRTDAFHPTLILDADGLGGASWLGDVTDQWSPTGLRYAELVVVVLPERQESIDTCAGYVFDDGAPAPAINRYVRTVTVQVLSARNARLIAERTFRGTDPRACQTYEFLSAVAPSLHGDPPNLDGEAQPWLADIVNPPAEQPA